MNEQKEKRGKKMSEQKKTGIKSQTKYKYKGE